ncbi:MULTISPECIES: peptidoglycan editing factor PgeF [Aerococcus]|uniref:peptidoglycan editing factor PgeF n=1 Tax=Aerococcus urinae (strain CCUG 59500 / ACS-120-V-Col10a) TaxID=2976812 RepID=UPI000200FB9D|nr:peptidoglycan editing factor PgeF [Aerococcus sp. Group 1]AEA01880.1 conserved hypothetical protein, YfiH family [Aerococcus sp. Group 1]MCY3031605.1 peptidoglycan editing factor PgeF [Aerococcus sp. Group 1]MCY3054977.1 peptidoglycan editing factor PgeF [Aerococcus sp. Group 1]MCY3056707.1 peptidoglycan editing factor PgeF [Aerococcus sp. Group 1]MCY3061478.1 peptidoglycan editing factor PgeF [Aerococcus sp. Group 1]
MSIHYYYNNPHLQMGITLRDPDLPEAGNMGIHSYQDLDAVLANRRAFFQATHISPDHFVQAHQSHSKRAVEVSLADGGKGALSNDTAIPQTDALYSFDEELMLGIFTADCVPILFYDQKTPLIGVIHSGWRGTVQNITQVTFEQIFADHPEVKAENIHVQIGPALSQKHFEVDEDVYLQFKDLEGSEGNISYQADSGKWHIDNQAVVRNQCLHLGIRPENIQVDPMDTYASPQGFSYRQNQTKGRHMGFIWQKDRLN